MESQIRCLSYIFSSIAFFVDTLYIVYRKKKQQTKKNKKKTTKNKKNKKKNNTNKQTKTNDKNKTFKILEYTLHI